MTSLHMFPFEYSNGNPLEKQVLVQLYQETFDNYVETQKVSRRNIGTKQLKEIGKETWDKMKELDIVPMYSHSLFVGKEDEETIFKVINLECFFDMT